MHGELRVPVRPGGGRQQQVRRVGDPLRRLLEEVVRDSLLEVDDAEAVDDRLRGFAVDEATHGLVAEIEAEPDHDLEPEIGPPAREDAAACCDDGGHGDSSRHAFYITRRCRTSRPSAGSRSRPSAVRSSGRCGAHTPRAARELLVARAEPQRRAQVVALDARKAGVELPSALKPRAGAAAAERLGDGGDDADLAGAVGVAPALRRPSGRCVPRARAASARRSS